MVARGPPQAGRTCTRAAHAMTSRHEFMLTGSFRQEHTDGEGCATLDSRRKGPTVPDNVRTDRAIALGER